jgi:hypothetical protein
MGFVKHFLIGCHGLHSVLYRIDLDSCRYSGLQSVAGGKSLGVRSKTPSKGQGRQALR